MEWLFGCKYQHYNHKPLTNFHLSLDFYKKETYIKQSASVMQTTGCSGKIVFFTIHFNPFLAYIAVRDLQSSQRNASVKSLLFASIFLYNQ